MKYVYFLVARKPKTGVVLKTFTDAKSALKALNESLKNSTEKVELVRVPAGEPVDMKIVLSLGEEVQSAE